MTLPTLDTIEIFGYNNKPDFTTATLDGEKLPIEIGNTSYSQANKILKINTLNLIDLNKGGPKWIVSWANVGSNNPHNS